MVDVNRPNQDAIITNSALISILMGACLPFRARSYEQEPQKIVVIRTVRPRFHKLNPAWVQHNSDMFVLSLCQTIDF